MPISRTRREGARRAAVQAYSKAIVEGRDQLALARKRDAAASIPAGDVDGPADGHCADSGGNRLGGCDNGTCPSLP